MTPEDQVEVVPQPPADSSPESSWWERAVSAARAATRSIPHAVQPPTLSDFPEVREKLRKAVSNIRGKLENTVKQDLRGRDGLLDAKNLYSKIPAGVRLAGVDAMLDYLGRKHVSHVLSVNNVPHAALDPDNVIFEDRPPNWQRGDRNMTKPEWRVAWRANLKESIKAGARPILMAVSKGAGAGIGALVEIPVTVGVETLHVVNQRKSVEEAALDALTTVGVTGAAGAATAGTLTVLGASGFTIGAPVVVPLVVVGGVAYVWVSADRIWEALDDETRAELEAQLAYIQLELELHARSVWSATSG